MIDEENNHFKVNIFCTENKIIFGVLLKKGSHKNRFSHDLPLTRKYKNIECMKSVVNANHSKILVTLYTSSGELKSFIYDINYNTFYSTIEVKQNFKEYFCKRRIFGLNTYYFKYKEDFINSCVDTDGNILIEFYDKDFNLYDYDIISNKYRISFAYSILYSNCTKNYFYISQEIPFQLLYGDNTQLENIKKNFSIENCFNIEQKEIEINEEENESEIEENESEIEEKEIEIEIEEETKEEESETKEISELEEELEISDIADNFKDDTNSTLIIIIIVFTCLISLVVIGYLIYKKYIKKPVLNVVNENLGPIIEQEEGDEFPAPIN